MLVEFVGMPGSGKTSVSAALISELESAGHNVVSYRDVMPLDRTKILYRQMHILALSIAALCHARVVISCVLKSLAGGRGAFRRLRRGFRILDLTCRTRARFDRTKLTILDQGPMQALWAWLFSGSIRYRHGVDHVVETVYGSYRPDYVVWVGCDPGLASERISLRREEGGNLTSFDSLDDAERTAKFCKSEPIFREIMMVVQGLGAHVIHIDGGAETARNAAIVMHIISAERLPSKEWSDDVYV